MIKQTVGVGVNVLSGFVHTLRVDLFRTRGLPYPWLKESGTVRFKLDQPWPQPSPISTKMPYAVLHVAGDEIQEFLTTVVARFQRQVKFSWLSAAQYLKNTPNLDCPDDSTFVRYMTRSIYAYFLTDDLDAADRKLLDTNGISSDSVWKSDLAPATTVEPFRGLYCTGSVCYYRKTAAGEFEILGIAMMDEELTYGELLRPSDGNSWLRAKMHVLQGATMCSAFVTHPKCHFPMDAAIAVTRTMVPKEHWLSMLLEPHMYMQLPLDYSVLHIKNGPGYNDPRLYYTAFSGAGASHYRLFEYSYAGMPGHAAFPPFTFGYLLNSTETEYLDFMRGYHEIILGFVRTVVADAEIDDVVVDWVQQCGHYSRGFSDGFTGPAGTVDRDELAACLAMMIWNCSIVHSADHREFYAIPMEHKPTRLRIPPPFVKTDCTFDERDLTQVDDRLRQYILQQANRDFVQALIAYDAGLTDNDYAAVDDMATSIQW